MEPPNSNIEGPRCRLCATPLDQVFADLGVSPLANSFLKRADLNRPETFYPLRAYVCTNCLLVQLEAMESPGEIFSDYAYFSSFSDTWLEHCRRFAEQMIRRFSLDRSSLVVEAASNDGYLLQYFVAAGIPVLGIEPAANVAEVALARGVPTRIAFLTRETALVLRREGLQADLLAANNVLAHVPDMHSFVAGIRELLKPSGVCTIEFPHLLNLIGLNQFDTIYHEHYSYLCLHTVERLLSRHGLAVFDVEQLPTHGGSLRVYAGLPGPRREIMPSVQRIRQLECDSGLLDIGTYRRFNSRIERTKLELWRFFVEAKRQGGSVAGYGAPAKGNTLLNYCGIGPEMLPYTVDRSPYKQGRYLPGTRIPVYAPERIFETRPDYILILPWNLKDEIIDQLRGARDWGARFVVPIPKLEVLD